MKLPYDLKESAETIAERALQVLSWDASSPKDRIQVHVAYQRGLAEADMRKLHGVVMVTQARLVSVAGPSQTPVALSLNASFMYLGFSCGAALGYVVIARTSIAWVGVAGAACVLGAMATSVFAWRRFRTH